MTRGPRNPRSANRVQETCPGGDYAEEEREFLLAIDRYKRTRRRPYPTWREVLDVLRGLGWRKVAGPSPSPSPSPGEGEGCGGKEDR